MNLKPMEPVAFKIARVSMVGKNQGKQGKAFSYREKSGNFILIRKSWNF